MRKRNYIFIGLFVAILSLINTSVFARDLPVVNNYDYSIDMFNTTYYISYDLDGGSLDKVNTYTPENNDFELGIPSKTGYVFLGWTGSNGHIPNPNVTVKKGTVMNLTFKANWEKVKNNISYDLSGGKNLGGYLYKDILTGEIKLGNPYREGYTFEGWTGSNGSTKQKNIVVSNINSNLSYTANWKIDDYAINYSLNDDSYVNATVTTNVSTYNLNTNNFILNNPSRTGYNFLGWTGSNGKTPQTVIQINKGSMGDRWYKANWKPIVYNISYTMNNGTNNANNPSTYTVEDSYTLQNPSRTGYNFDGWSGTGVSGTNKNVSVSRPSTGNRSYTAHWTPITYSISYNYNSGSVATANPSTYTIETNSFTLNKPTRYCHTFTGYTGTGLSSSTKDVTISKGSYGDRSYAANWSLNTYTVSVTPTIDGAGPGDGNTDNFIFDVYKNDTKIKSGVHSYSDTINCSDKIRVVAKGRTGYTISANSDVTKTIEGNYTFTPTWKDTIAPVINNSSFTNWSTNSNGTKNFTITTSVTEQGSGIAKYCVKLNAGAGGTGSSEVCYANPSEDFTHVMPGDRTIEIIVYDKQGNRGSKTQSVHV